ncbi:MAG: TIGR00730 family Rossman fold protein [Verrucomicrobiota bacterium]
MIQSMCVFCGSSPGGSTSYTDAAHALGEFLAQNQIRLVYGGASVGLMGTLADACLHAGGEVVGVIPQSLIDCEIAHHGLTKLHVVDSMHERKAMMNELSEGFISLPGGCGTLEEMFETLTWLQLSIHEKPCGLLNIDNYFASLIEFFDHMVEERFLLKEHRKLLAVEKDHASLITAMNNAKPAPPVAKWVDRHIEGRI